MSAKINFVACVCTPAIAFFLYLGWSSYSDYQERATVVVSGEWIPTERSSIHESNFSCPATGELVGNVWEHDGVWKAHTDSGRNTFLSLSNEYKDEEHAKYAVEKFIREYQVCYKH